MIEIWKKFLEVVRVYLQLHTYALRLRHFPNKFLARMMIKKEIEKEEDTIKRPQKKKVSVSNFVLFAKTFQFAARPLVGHRTMAFNVAVAWKFVRLPY